MSLEQKTNAPPPGGHVFQATGTIFELVRDIIVTNVLTKFHDDRTINVASREKCHDPLGGHVFPPTGNIFEHIQDIIGTNCLAKFHDDRTINVASRVFIRKNAPPGGHVFKATEPIFEIIQDVIWTNLLTKHFMKIGQLMQMLTPHNGRRTTHNARQTKGDHKSSP
ncbi:hypothetical protein DPMN_074860 [Dreissena polymorpha]|uniref:Uncharacterized protein n=1 Tax=Dreissena polymorpha TaxID=45954 RepID=A0A9D3YKL7_DREPO|nr:hypothetical protein DPMN_074860 [Dreissena polymorpha]